MKIFRTIAVLGSLIAASSSWAFANTIPLRSFAEGSNHTMRHGASPWAMLPGDSTWLDTSSVGPGSSAYGYYQFATQFSAAALDPFAFLGRDGHCSDNRVNCMSADLIPLSASSLQGGNKTAPFTVEAVGIVNSPNTATGGNFATSLAVAVAPEPGSIFLLGTGLLGAAGIFFRRRAIA